jgi:hypothetical protein
MESAEPPWVYPNRQGLTLQHFIFLRAAATIITVAAATTITAVAAQHLFDHLLLYFPGVLHFQRLVLVTCFYFFII